MNTQNGLQDKDLEAGEPSGFLKSEAELIEELQNGAEEFAEGPAGIKATTNGAPPGNSMMSTLLQQEGSALSRGQRRQAQGVTLQWRSLTYTVTVGFGKRRRSKRVLLDASGCVQPGHLLAVLGGTGGGKSSLLNALAGRLPRGGSLEGEVLVDGQPRTEAFRSNCGYVMQDDVLFSNLTVQETLEFAAAIRLPASVSAATKQQLVADAMAELGLTKVADTFVGNAWVRGVSGGERKRVHIATEVLANQGLLFADEPTSGLDAFQAQNIMETLRALARDGRTVVATVHQPRSSIWSLFDFLLVLSEGRTLYYGPAAAAPEYFASTGYACPPGYNPADFILDVTSKDHRTPESEAATEKRVQLLADLHSLRSAAGSAADLDCCHPAGGLPLEGSSLQENGSQAASRSQLAAGSSKRRFANSALREFWLLSGRAWRQSSRARIEQIISTIQTVFVAALLAWLYSGMSQSEPGGVQDEVGLLFMCAVTTAMNVMMGALVAFTFDKPTVDRERAARAYRMLPYYLSRLACDTPLRVAQGLLFSAVIYWAAGLNPKASAFFIFCALNVCIGLAGQALGMAVSVALPMSIALAVAPFVVIFLMLFSGFYVNDATLPAVLRWIKYISHLFWGLVGLAVNDFRGRTGWACPVSGAPPGCEISGEEILTQLHFEGFTVAEAFMGLLLLTFGFHLAGYTALRLRKPRFLPLTQANKGLRLGAPAR
ncbi:hypothetical protein ABPG77_003801 [Micractinium sp. CCAP 211/92]